MQADLPGEHSLQICIRISSSSIDSCNSCDLSHLNKKQGQGVVWWKEWGKVEDAGINQFSTCGGRKRSATTTCLHPQWTKLVITHLGGRGWHSLHGHYRRQEFVTGNLLQFRHEKRMIWDFATWVTRSLGHWLRAGSPDSDTPAAAC